MCAGTNRSTRLLASVGTVLTVCAAAQAGVYPDSASRLWPGGVVPYEFDTIDPIPVNSQCCVLAAMDEWEAVANVTFVPRDEEENYLLITNGTVGPAYPPPEGYRGNGAHTLLINNWCSGGGSCSNCQAVFGLAHEVGHVLGLYHTHQRQDRDFFMFIDYCVIDDAFSGNYCIADDSLAWPRGQADIDSIMSYPLCTFSICRSMLCSGGMNSGNACAVDGDCPGGTCDVDPACPSAPSNCPSGCTDCPDLGDCPAVADQCDTGCGSDPAKCAPIKLLPPYDTIWAGLEFCGGQCPPPVQCVGQRNHLSRFDQLVMSFLYPESNWRFVDRLYGGNEELGTFHKPFSTFGGGEADVPEGGTVWIVEPGAYSAVGVYTKAMLVLALLGGAVLGD